MVTARDFVAALQRSDRAAALAIVKQLLAQREPLGDQWRSVAQFAAISAEWGTALAAMERYVARAPQDPGRQLARAEILAQSGQLPEAVDIIARVVELHPQDGALWHFLGTAHNQLGDIGQSVDCFERALALLPPSGPTWLGWANVQDFRADARAIDRIRDAVSKTETAPPETRAPILFGLGIACDALGHVSEAFDAFAQGAALVRTVRRHSAAADRAAGAAIMQAYPQPGVDTQSGGERSILVTGLPRSGTTLVEQILVSHSAVTEGGEINLFGIAAEHVGGPFAPVARAALANGATPFAAWQPFVTHYEHLLAERFGPDGRIVDKSLNISRFAGMVALALPQSPLIWLRRDPLDTAWSCFRTYFATGLAWSFDLNDMAEHFAMEDALYHHWRDVVGLPILEVPYREIVAAPETWIDRILAHCGLPFEPGVHQFHQTRRAVATSSVNQVRRPIYSSAVGSSAEYRAHLDGFVEAYHRARRALGLSEVTT